MSYKALLLTKNKEEEIQSSINDVNDQENPEFDIKIKITYSTLNYKDCLAISGVPGIIRSYPMVPGIDLVGEVIKEKNTAFEIGDEVILNGYGVGEKYWGGFAEFVNLKSNWLIKKPKGLSRRATMSIGTAGYTAMLCVMELLKYDLNPSKDEVLVSGATGGVGCISIIVLSRMGYNVIALTGKKDKANFLKDLGAKELIFREDFSGPHKILEAQRWKGAIDTVGGNTLSKICASTKYNGVVAACGNAESIKINTSIAPFILRNIKLMGVDSVYQENENRVLAWDKLSEILDEEILDNISSYISMKEIPHYVREIMEGKNSGRVVVDINKS
ncbi:MAG: hypothetical protein CMP24_03880 [Rickettsiales bacterium]|nr:hypothetical protein [Rickettsiales bacterium]|tara:strand:- start:408 stop:1400 length:993 start_codon:yes stop_codon:yes gene_type:complete